MSGGMKFRIVFAVSVLVFGFVKGGWMGLFFSFLGLGICGAVFPYRPVPSSTPKISLPVDDSRDWRVQENVRRGSEDPTRPTEDDMAGLITTVIEMHRGPYS